MYRVCLDKTQSYHRTLIRLDVRADVDGNLAILEANPKPDLKRPSAGVTSLSAYGLEAEGLTYHDLILSLIADRLDYLLSHRLEIWPHLLELLEPSVAFAIPAAKKAKPNEFADWKREEVEIVSAEPSIN